MTSTTTIAAVVTVTSGASGGSTDEGVGTAGTQANGTSNSSTDTGKQAAASKSAGRPGLVAFLVLFFLLLIAVALWVAMHYRQHGVLPLSAWFRTVDASKQQRGRAATSASLIVQDPAGVGSRAAASPTAFSNPIYDTGTGSSVAGSRAVGSAVGHENPAYVAAGRPGTVTNRAYAAGGADNVRHSSVSSENGTLRLQLGGNEKQPEASMERFRARTNSQSDV
jgi:hypothetical protein